MATERKTSKPSLMDSIESPPPTLHSESEREPNDLSNVSQQALGMSIMQWQQNVEDMKTISTQLNKQFDKYKIANVRFHLFDE